MEEDAPNSRSPSPSAANDGGSDPPSPPSGPAPAAGAVVTVAASSLAPLPPPQTLTLALPIQRHPSPSPAASHSASAGREDCWSDGATSALVDAWGERYLDLGRGAVKQNHWQEIADAVSARDDYTKNPKTDAQCKNRVDTLKKKYKNERSKSSSSWPFFHRLDHLLGPNFLKPSAAAKPPTVSSFPPQFPQRSRTQTVVNAVKRRSRSPPPDSSDSLPPLAPATNKKKVGDGVRELTKAIAVFGEVYERVERGKLQQVVEMEKQRMVFVQDLETQRMQFFLKAQMELSQLDRRQRPQKLAAAHKRSRGHGDLHRRRHHRGGPQIGNDSNGNNSDD